MALYTYLVFGAGDAPSQRVTFELGSDNDADILGLFVLRDHEPCDYVEVWCGGRAVVVRRADEPAFNRRD